MQKRIVRIIRGKPRLYPSLELFRDLKILPIHHLNALKLTVFCHKWKYHSSLPDIFKQFLTPIKEVHDHFTRTSHLFFIDTPRTCYAENSVKFKAPFVWNELLQENPDLVGMKNLKLFKSEITRHLLFISEIDDIH